MPPCTLHILILINVTQVRLCGGRPRFIHSFLHKLYNHMSFNPLVPSSWLLKEGIYLCNIQISNLKISATFWLLICITGEDGTVLYKKPRFCLLSLLKLTFHICNDQTSVWISIKENFRNLCNPKFVNTHLKRLNEFKPLHKIVEK